MKKIIFLLLFLLIATPVFAGPIVTQGGFEYTPVNKTYVTPTDRILTDEIVWTPASGNKIILLGVSYSSALASAFYIEQGTTKIIPDTQSTASGIRVIGNGTPIWKGAVDQTLTLTNNAVCKQSILLWGYESTR